MKPLREPQRSSVDGHLKIGIILPGFSADESDWCIPVQLHLSRRLSQRADVHIFPLRYPHRRQSYSVFDATVHPLGAGQVRGLRRLRLLGRAVATVVDEHRRRPFDVLHAMWADEPGVVAVVAGRLLGTPTVVSLLGGELVGWPDIGYGSQLSRISRWATWIALRRATRITAGSTYLRRLTGKHVSPERVLSIPLGVDTSLFCPADEPNPATPLEAGDIKLLHVASLVPVKEQATLLQAFSQVVARIPNIHLHMVGDGPLRADLGALANALDIARYVTFHGSVSHERMPAYYRAADVCVLSSRHEGQELVTLEAAACARTTVGTAVGLLPDLVPATQVVPVGDAEALAQALLETLRDPECLIARGQECRARVLAGYTLDHTVAALCNLYDELVNQR